MNRTRRALLLALAGLLLIASIFGVVLPLLPAVPLILAASWLLKKAGPAGGGVGPR